VNGVPRGAVDDEFTVRSPAKLNLVLHITGRRADGYHNLQTVFQLIDLCDQMVFSIDADDRVRLVQSLPGVPEASNLIIRAAELLRPHRKRQCGWRIRLAKHIPIGGGLGGGSSNAATTLLVLNRLWHCGLTLAELASLGATLGADVPVFVLGRNAVGEGIGEILHPIDLPSRWYLVIYPACAVNTAAIFSDPELTRDTPPMTIAGLLAGTGRNDCEAVTRRRYPEVDQALAWLARFGQASMSGTGSSVFVALPNEAQARAAGEQTPGPWRWFVARGIDRSPTHEALID
jgi:4-diphosphocytidyl-2-C-methyl-D-erythritol kinase